MEQFYGAIIWYHLMAPFYGMCVPGIILSSLSNVVQSSKVSTIYNSQLLLLDLAISQPVNL